MNPGKISFEQMPQAMGVILEKLSAQQELLKQLMEQQTKDSKPPVEESEIIDRKTLCKRLQITEPTAIRMEKEGRIPSFRIASNVRYDWGEVVKSLNEKSTGSRKK